MGGSGTFAFGNGVTAAAPGTATNPFLVKFNGSGVAQWAKTTQGSSPNNNSGFNSVTLDSFGNPYVAGSNTNVSAFDFGNGILATGGNGGLNSLMVKYDTNGVVQLAKPATPAGDTNLCNGIGVDSVGHVWCGEKCIPIAAIPSHLILETRFL